jgi:hypothetical protein
VAKPQYSTPDYRRAYRALRRANQLRDLDCVQPVCLYEEAGYGRTIPVGDPIDVAHDDTGQHILGPAHRYCNRVDGGRRRQHVPPKRWIL